MEVTQKFPSKSPLTSPNLRHHGKKMVPSPRLKFDFRKGFPVKLYDNHHGSKSLSHRKSIDGQKTLAPVKMMFTNDPLNLAAVTNKAEGCKSPQTYSPVLDRSHDFEPSNVQPFDVKDPLNLNCLNENQRMLKPPRKRRKRKRRNTFNADSEHNMSINLDTSVQSDQGFLISPVEKERKCSINATNNDAMVLIKNDTPVKTPKKEKQLDHTSNTSHRVINFNDKNMKYRFGNYIHYYNFNRNTDDQRLCLLKKNWFEDKRCLDVGCNTGLVTCYIAKHFAPHCIVGVDIDCGLIKVAKKNARQNGIIESKNIPKFPLSIKLTHGVIESSQIITNKKSGFPKNAKFITENYVPPSEEVLEHVKSEYDVILCLSVTKWVQLNFSDVGLKLMFKKMFLQLKPGGRLLIEPQTYSSYKKKKNLTPGTLKNFTDMQLMPVNFIKYLLSNEVGFARSECLGYSKQKKSGFDRPLYLLIKGGSMDKTHQET